MVAKKIEKKKPAPAKKERARRDKKAAKKASKKTTRKTTKKKLKRKGEKAAKAAKAHETEVEVNLAAESSEPKTPFEKAIEGLLESFQENLAVEFTRKLGADVMEKAAETLMAQFVSRASDWVSDTLKRVGDRAMEPKAGEALGDEDLKTGAEREPGAQAETRAWRRSMAELMEMLMAKFSLAFVSALVETLASAEKKVDSPQGDGSA